MVGANVPFVTELNTNAKTINNSGEIAILGAGLWNIDASIEVTGVVGTIGVSLYADGVLRDTRSTTLDLATDAQSVSFTDAIRVILAQYPQTATISMQVNTAGVTTNGKIRIENVR